MQTNLGPGSAGPSPDSHVQSPGLLCVGRMTLASHDGLVTRGDEAQIEEVNARTTPWSVPASGDASRAGAAGAAWSARLRAVDVNPEIRPPGVRTAILDERQPAPALRVLLRHDARGDTTLRAGEALVDAGTHALWLRVGYDPGAEADVLRYVTALGTSYRALSPEVTAAAARGGAFCLARGGFVRPFESDERVRVTLDAPTWGFSEIQVATDSRGNPDGTSSPVEEWQARVGAAATSRVRATLVRAGARTVAGLAGEEVVARLTEGPQTTLAFEWASTGTASGAAPYVRVTASAPDSGREAALLTRWDELLSGMRRGQPGRAP